MIFSRPVKNESRRLHVERLENRCLLSADLFGFKLDFDDHRSKTRDDDFFGRREERDERFQQQATNRHHDRDDQFGQEGRRESRSQQDFSSNEIRNDAFSVLTNRFTSNTNPVSQRPAAPTTTVVFTRITVPVSNITFLTPSTIDNFSAQQSNAALQGENRSPLDATRTATVTTTTPATSDEAIIASITAGQSASTDATTLISTTPVVTRFEQTIIAPDIDWGTTESYESMFSGGVADNDEAEIGRWLNRVDLMKEKFSDLDRTLDQLAKERVQAVEGMLGVTPHYRQIHRDTEPMLNQTDGIFLINETSHEQAAVIDTEHPNVLAEGWTVGIGFHRALEFAYSESYANELLTTIQQPVDSGAIHVSSDQTEQDNLSETTTTDSSSQLFGVAVCVAGIHYLRIRNQARRHHRE